MVCGCLGLVGVWVSGCCAVCVWIAAGSFCICVTGLLSFVLLGVIRLVMHALLFWVVFV